MADLPPFPEFPKIARLNREMVVTEKIDGTNASVLVGEGAYPPVLAASRSRWINPGDDNFGFARYVYDNTDMFRALGPGHHFGEWWGAGIGRRYGLDHKRFSLFNTGRWNEETTPEGLFVVPVLHVGRFNTGDIEMCLRILRDFGSTAAPGFTKPEGVVVWHSAARTYLKATLEKDAEWKGKPNG